MKLGHVTTQLTELSSDRARLFDLSSDTVLCNENELTEIPFLIPKQGNVVIFFQLNLFQLMVNWWFGILVVPPNNNPFHFRGSQISKPHPNQHLTAM